MLGTIGCNSLCCWWNGQRGTAGQEDCLNRHPDMSPLCFCERWQKRKVLVHWFLTIPWLNLTSCPKQGKRRSAPPITRPLLPIWKCVPKLIKCLVYIISLRLSFLGSRWPDSLCWGTFTSLKHSTTLSSSKGGEAVQKTVQNVPLR